MKGLQKGTWFKRTINWISQSYRLGYCSLYRIFVRY